MTLSLFLMIAESLEVEINLAAEKKKRERIRE